MSKRAKLIGGAVAVAVAAGGIALVTLASGEPAGEETNKRLRIAGLHIWAEIKRIGYQAPAGWAQMPGTPSTDEWGNELHVIVKESVLSEVPEELMGDREVNATPESTVWVIVVSSMGPDETMHTRDDLVFWRMNGADDGQYVGHRFIRDEELWGHLAPYPGD
ncbi:MAG: hypothetical protein NCW75_01800 [Phycisphaera sp.]|nr:MAG: hypothetical protein NCW75_01800 [Phycisphaera sp.]